MDYRQKLKVNRFRSSTVEGRDFNEEMESDRGRALTSAAVRRLQQKTQVFPLEANAAVRSRLTHSLEVLQVGRYIGKKILKKLDSENLSEEFKLSAFKEGFVSSIEVACLLHDIGNPPFGHFGEKAISLWAEDRVKSRFESEFPASEEREKRLKDLIEFEGNAQGLRILHSLQTLNLTYTQLACLLKYTRPAYEDKPKTGNFTYRKKKPGFYLSEEELVRNIGKSLSIGDGCRFPLAYVMEAADDISYCVADLDDALDKGILTVDSLHNAIKETWNGFKNNENESVISEGYLTSIADEALSKFHEEPVNKNHAYILTLRTKLVNDLANYASTRYIDNHQAIFDGSFDEPLINGKDEFYYATETLRNVAVSNVFSSKEVESLELKGYAVISGLLDIYSPLIEMDFDSFKELAKDNFSKKHPIETRLYHKLSSKHKNTYLSSVEKIYESSEASQIDKLNELYSRVRLIIDYISGMTDHFSMSEFQELSGAI